MKIKKGAAMPLLNTLIQIALKAAAAIISALNLS